MASPMQKSTKFSRCSTIFVHDMLDTIVDARLTLLPASNPLPRFTPERQPFVGRSTSAIGARVWDPSC